MLSDEQIRRYDEDGYVIPDFQLCAETVADIRAAHDRLLAKHPQFADYCPALLAYDTSFLNIARMPALLDMVEQLIGPDFALWNSSFFAKPLTAAARRRGIRMANTGRSGRWRPALFGLP